MEKMNQSVAYICPVCAAVTGRAMNIFNFSGNKKIDLACGVKKCRSDAVRISSLRDEYRISADCPYCGSVHDFSIKKASFWAKDFFEFDCPVSNMGLFFIGDPDRVKKCIKEQEKILSELAREFETEEELSLMLDMVSVVSDMIENKMVVCECGSDKVKLDVDDEMLNICCERCGTTMAIKPSEEEYERLMDTPILKIHK